MARQKGASTHSAGFQTLKLTIQEIANGLAYGVDNFGVPRTAPMSLLPAKSPLPAVGDVWLISKALTGVWMFFAIINAPGPVTVTGNTDDGTGFWHLLQQLDDAGYIVNDVVDDGGGGGSPGPTGPSGPSGPSGSPGPTGPSGGTGGPGPSGGTGGSGGTGSPGPSGPSGPSGGSGGSGGTGGVGPSGPTGPTGGTGGSGGTGGTGGVGPSGPSGPQGAGTILATQVYAPSPSVIYVLNTSALTVVDATNATLAFTVPANGIVDVDVECYMATNPTGIIILGLKNHSGGAQVGFSTGVLDISSTAITISRIRTKFHLTGLTPGALQLDLAAYVGNSVTADIVAFGYTGTTTAGGGPLIMQATASI